MAMIYDNRGDYDEALDLYNQSLDIAKKIGDQEGFIRTLGNISLIYEKIGDHESALYHLHRSSKVSKTDNTNRQRLLNIRSIIREKIGRDNFDMLEKKVKIKISNVD